MNHQPLHIWAVNVETPIHDSVFQELLRFTALSKQYRIKRFYRREDAQRALFGELLIRAQLIELQGLRNSDISFSETAFGKPLLVNFPNLHFNVSHSGRWVISATGSSTIGVDVEQIAQMEHSVSEHVFCDFEHAHIISSNDPNDMFFRYWTLKESYIKLIGKGLSQPLNSFGIKFREDNSAFVEVEKMPQNDIHFKQYFFDKQYHVAACAHHSHFPSQVKMIGIDALIDRIRSGA